MSDHDTPHRTPQDPEEIRRYLLGRLSAEENDALESHLLHDGRLFELAEATEDDLIDRYVRGELPSDDAKRFERRLLPSRRIGERVEVARALAAWVDRERGERPVADRLETGGVVIPLFRRTAHLAWAAALVAAIAAGALAFEVARLHDRLDEAGTPAGVEHARVAEEAPEPVAPEPTPADEPEVTGEEAEAIPAERVEDLERELVAARDRIASLERETEERPATSEAEAGPVESLAIAQVFLALATRGDSDGQTLVLGDSERVEIQLDLDRRRPSSDLRARILRDETVIWDEPGVEVVTEAGQSMARLFLPRESLTAGRYRVELSEPSKEKEALSYPFSVER